MFKYNAGGHTQEVKVDANENEHSSQNQYTPKKKKPSICSGYQVYCCQTLLEM